MGWEKTILASDLPDGGRKVVTAGSKTVLLIKHCSKVYAISSTCPHWGLPLEMGRLTDDCGIICPWHRSGFDLDTGDVKAWAPWPPGLGLVLGATSRKKVLPTFPTKVEDNAIWVMVGQAEALPQTSPLVSSAGPAPAGPPPAQPAAPQATETPPAPAAPPTAQPAAPQVTETPPAAAQPATGASTAQDGAAASGSGTAPPET
jgi:nitrite reductase/ring-hydroxylating ferredoxin subunit